MAWVCRCIVISLVATYTGVGRARVIAVDVAHITLVADGSMCSGKRINSAVVKC